MEFAFNAFHSPSICPIKNKLHVLQTSILHSSGACGFPLLCLALPFVSPDMVFISLFGNRALVPKYCMQGL